MGQKIVGWFAILVGLVLVTYNVYVILEILGRDPLVVADYVLAAFRGVMAAGGGALVYFGLGRLKRPWPPSRGRGPGEKDAAGGQNLPPDSHVP